MWFVVWADLAVFGSTEKNRIVILFFIFLAQNRLRHTQLNVCEKEELPCFLYFLGMAGCKKHEITLVFSLLQSQDVEHVYDESIPFERSSEDRNASTNGKRSH